MHLLPWGKTPLTYGQQLLGLESVSAHRAWRALEWHSPAAPGGNRRPAVGGSAFGQRGCPPRDWCICPGLTPTLCVLPGGLLVPLCTQGGW